MESETASFGFGDIIDLIKVNAVNVIAISLSLTRIEEWVRLFGMIAALIYTTLKIIQLMDEMRTKIRARKSVNSIKSKLNKS